MDYLYREVTRNCGLHPCSLVYVGRKRTDLAGQEFGLWMVVERAKDEVQHNGNLLWLCKCQSCGRERLFPRDSLVNRSPRCVCLMEYQSIGHSGKRGTRHAFARVAQGIISRVKNKSSPGYKNYGGRSDVNPWIEPEWDTGSSRVLARGLEAELGARPSKSHSVDRIDVNKGYVKGNLRWASAKTQAANRRPNIQFSTDSETRVSKTFSTMEEAAAWFAENYKDVRISTT